MNKIKCTYNENECPKCGYPMSQDDDKTGEEPCSNPDCDFIYQHCGECKKG